MFAERLDQYFEIKDISEQKKLAVLLTCLEEDVYKTLRDLYYPALPKEKTFEEVCEFLGKQYGEKTPSAYRVRRDFYNAQQEEDESITAWFQRIKHLAVDCRFGNRFSAILLDHFISGMRSSPVLDRLYDEDDETLTVQKALDIVVAKEGSFKDEGSCTDGNNDEKSK